MIELLVVVLIIGILAAIALPQYQRAVDKSRVSKLMTLVKNIQTQQELFYLTEGRYADNCEELEADLPSGFTQDSDNPMRYISTSGGFTTALACLNGGTRVFGAVTNGSDSLHVSIEMIGFHLPGTDKYLGNEGRTYCRAANRDARSLSACRSFGGKKKNKDSYWVN